MKIPVLRSAGSVRFQTVIFLFMRVPKLFTAILLLFFCGCISRAPREQVPQINEADWQSKLEARLPELGHRNWILVVDKAYPAQSAAGVEVINTGAELPDVLQHAMGKIKASRHVAPVIYQDSELQYLTDSLVSGVEALQKNLSGHLSGVAHRSLSHDSLLAMTSADAAKYRILVLKTESLVPYSSVFIQLDCGYWNSEQEGLLRKSMGSKRGAAARDTVAAP